MSNANAMRMEVSMKIAIFIRASVYVSQVLKVSNVIDARAAIMDFPRVAARVRFIETLIPS